MMIQHINGVTYGAENGRVIISTVVGSIHSSTARAVAHGLLKAADEADRQERESKAVGQ